MAAFSSEGTEVTGTRSAEDRHLVPPPTAAGSVPRRGTGPACSAALHGIVLALAVLLGQGRTPPADAVHWVPVDLVQLGPRTQSPRAADRASAPQEAAAKVSRPAQSKTPARGLPVPAAHAAAPVRRKHEGPKIRAERPAADFDKRLRAEAGQLQSALSASETRRRNGLGTAPRDAASSGATGAHVAYDVRDFLRAQIERHWNFDVASLGALPYTIPVHVVLDSDGNVETATAILDPRHRRDPAYRDLALSARNAVLVSSPLRLPPGTPASMRDVVLTLDPRAALR